MTDRDEIRAQIVASREAGSFDPVRGQVREHRRPASIHDPRIRLPEALSGVELTASEERALWWLLDWDALDNIAAMIEKRIAEIRTGEP